MAEQKDKVAQVPAKRDASPPAKPADEVTSLEEVIKAKMMGVSRRDFYKVGSEKTTTGWQDVLAPNSRILQKWSNESEAPISTKVMHRAVDEKGATVTVRGWIGDEARPKVVKEETVSMLFAHELEFLLTEAVANGITIETREDGQYQKKKVRPPFDLTEPDEFGVSRIVLREPVHQLHVLSQWIRLKRFAERVCLTKAESRIHRKLLSADWRDEEEILHEESEARAAAADAGSPPEAPGTNGDEQKPPVQTERLIPQGVKQEQTGKTVSAMAVTSLLTRFKDLGDKFPLPDGQDHKTYLLAAAVGVMFERGAQIQEAKLENMTPADSGKLWELIGKVAHGDEAALKAIDDLHASGQKVIATIAKRGQK